MDGIDFLEIDDKIKAHAGERLKELIQNTSLLDKWIDIFQRDHNNLLDVYNKATGLELQSLNLQAKGKSIKTAYRGIGRTKESQMIYQTNKLYFFIEATQKEYRKYMIQAQYDLINFREWFSGQTQKISVHFTGDFGEGIDKKELNLTLKELYSTYSFLVDVKIKKDTQTLEINSDILKNFYQQNSNNKHFQLIDDELFRWIQYLIQERGAVDKDGKGIEWMTYEIYIRYKKILGGRKKGFNYRSTPSGVYSSFINFLSNYIETQLSENDASKYDTGLMGGDAGTLIQAKYMNEKNSRTNPLSNQFLIIGQLENLITGLKELKNKEPEGFYRLTNVFFSGGDATLLRNKIRDYLKGQLTGVLNKIT